VCHVGGVIFSVLAIGRKFRWFKLGRGDGILMTLKIRNIPSFGGEVTPEDPCRKTLWHVKDSASVKEIFC
jgi:hypothetical protein